jgi:ATP-dependent exoDNAse (exonuclease V) alpha subunit
MAIYHFTLKNISRGTGRNIISAAAYRRAAKFFDEEEGKTWNYSNKPHIIHREILVPANAPLWAKEYTSVGEQSNELAEKLWNKVCLSEKRIDARLAKEIEFALPMELTQEQNVQLVREFLQDEYNLKGILCDWNIHWDAGNPHVHVLLTTRELTQNGFGKKLRWLDDKVSLNRWREQWASYANFHLRKHGFEVRIDHRSYKDQGIDLNPSVHEGKNIRDMKRRGIETDKSLESEAIKKENLRRIKENPNLLFKKLINERTHFNIQDIKKELRRYLSFDFETQLKLADKIFKAIEAQESVFTEDSLKKALKPYQEDNDIYLATVAEVLTSSNLMYVGQGADGKARFTTKAMFAQENEIIDFTNRLASQGHFQISQHKINRVLNKNSSLTPEQVTALRHILSPKAISCVIGKAGTGKSFSLKVANEIWAKEGLRVFGIALAGIASEGLQTDAGIKSSTIHSFCYRIEKGSLKLKPNDVIVMDEAGMTDNHVFLKVLKQIHKSGAKLVLVGDPEQLQPIGPGATFRAIVERTGFSELEKVYRQKQDWQKDATVNFAKGHTKEALVTYQQQNCIHLEEKPNDAMGLLVKHWQKDRVESPAPIEESLILAHRNKDVHKFNQMIRAKRVLNGEVEQGFSVEGREAMKLAVNDRILFYENSSSLNLKNGRFGTVVDIELNSKNEIEKFKVKLDKENRVVTIDPSTYKQFSYGYAATIHKSQGVTVNNSYIYAEGNYWDRHLTYVAMTRHREKCHLYAPKTQFKHFHELQQQLSKARLKDSLINYPITFGQRRNIEPRNWISIVGKKLRIQLKKLKKAFKTSQDDSYRRKIKESTKQSKKIMNDEKSNSFENLIIEFLELQIEHDGKHLEYMKVLKAPVEVKKQATDAMMQTSKKIQALGEKISHHASFSDFAINQNIITKKYLPDLGGYKTILNRAKNNNLTQDDKHFINRVIKEQARKAQSQNQVQTLKQGRGQRL